MNHSRSSGILLHPTSLPSKYGIGDLGEEAYHFVDFLKRSKQTLWQVLPLNPVGYGESPYQCLSAFAGNPTLISIDELVESGYLSKTDIMEIPIFNTDYVEFFRVKEYKHKLLKKAFSAFKTTVPKTDYYQFVNKSKYWLEEYALFMALKKNFNEVSWHLWEKSIAVREKYALEKHKSLLAEEVEYQYFLQYIFYIQWKKLKNYANRNGIKIIGDMPIYVSYDSSDTWANPELFELDESLRPINVAGVPPDYFSETGQLWGNPLYNWSTMEKDDYKWWRKRIEALLDVVDIIRIDHFRGFESYWEVPAGEKTAINGRWVKAPGDKLFSKIKEYIEDLPVIAEDLGIITPEVEALKNKFDFPGMKVLQFLIESKEVEQFSPYYHEKNSVVYTGTHDNDTMLGWYRDKLTKNPEVIKLIDKYFYINDKLKNHDICWHFIELAYQSMSNTAIIPLQDVLGLDGKARMNYPGTIEGNWLWRYRKEFLTREIEDKLSDMVLYYNRYNL